MKTITGTCKHCGKEFTYTDCTDLAGMIGESQEYNCCRECAEKQTVDFPDHV